MNRSDNQVAPAVGAKMRTFERVAAGLLMVAISGLTAVVVHDFFASADRWVYLATDDGLANVSYALAQQGRYGFLTSPITIDITRNHGMPDYGPWYFLIAGGLTWLFGYSLALIRSVHLWVVVVAAIAARQWFRSASGTTPAWALVGLGFPLAFTIAEWPMARPDPGVTLFTIGFLVAAGRAIQRDAARMWLLAGFLAGCAGTSHLIAAPLMPAAGLVAAVYWRLSKRRLPVSSFHRTVGWTFYGGLIAVLIFYTGFGFRIGDQIRFLTAYRSMTTELLATTSETNGFWSLVSRHFVAAYGVAGTPPVTAAVLIWIGAIAMLARSWSTDQWRRTTSMMLPPLVAWTAYLAGLGTYSNFHLGYTVLNHALALWTAAALTCLVCESLSITSTGRIAVASFTVSAALLGFWAIAGQESRVQARSARSSTWVTASDYVGEVLATVPQAATAWGAITFGIENPDRIQLVSYFDASRIMERIPPTGRSAVMPTYLIWGYQNDLALLADVAHGQAAWPQQIAAMVPGVHYELTSMVAAEPYGVSRIYRLRADAGSAAVAPAVSVFDGARRRWLRSGPMPIESRFSPLPAGTLQIDQQRAIAATHTYGMELAGGNYLLRVGVSTGTDARVPRMISAGSHERVSNSSNGLAPSADVVAYDAGDQWVWVVLRHTGGIAFISQFDPTGAAAITRIELMKLGMAESLDAVPAAPALALTVADWQPTSSEVTVTPASRGFTVDGNATSSGYQLMSKPFVIPARATASIQIAVSRERGSVCVGLLDAGTQQWVIPADQLLGEYQLTPAVDRNVRLVVANCGAAIGGTLPSRFTIGTVSVAIQPPGFYSDRMIEAMSPRQGSR